MRALAFGSVVLGFAAVLLSWDASKRFTHVQVGPLVPSFEIGRAEAYPPAQQAPAIGTRDFGVPKSGVDASDGAPLEATKPVSRLSFGSQPPLPNTAKQVLDPPTLGIRQVTPGSKAHAEAIASTIASNEYRNTVEPLARLYFAFFDRTADYEGLNYYIDERDGGVSLDSIADEFAGSPEFRLRYSSLDNAAFIDRMYRNVFDTPPDSAQRAHWIAQLEAGMSRGEMMVAFSESPSFRAATGNEVFVTLAYAETLGRHPDPAGFTRWVRFLDAGNPREAVIAGLLGGG